MLNFGPKNFVNIVEHCAGVGNVAATSVVEMTPNLELSDTYSYTKGNSIDLKHLDLGSDQGIVIQLKRQ